MIETPRAAILAGEIASRAEFFFFGTNDLTQMTLGISRDDAGKFLPDYIDETKAGIFSVDSFQSLDQKDVGFLVKSAIYAARKKTSWHTLSMNSAFAPTPSAYYLALKA